MTKEICLQWSKRLGPMFYTFLFFPLGIRADDQALYYNFWLTVHWEYNYLLYNSLTSKVCWRLWTFSVGLSVVWFRSENHSWLVLLAAHSMDYHKIQSLKRKEDEERFIYWYCFWIHILFSNLSWIGSIWSKKKTQLSRICVSRKKISKRKWP